MLVLQESGDYSAPMSSAEILEQIKALTPEERLELLEKLLERSANIAETPRPRMAEAEGGKLNDRDGSPQGN